MKVYVNNQEQKVLTAKVFPAPYNRKEDCEYVVFTQDVPSDLRLICEEEIKKVVIRPLSKKIACSYDSHTISIPACENDNFSVEYNDKCILIFASPKRVNAYTGRVVTFEPGYHDIGKMVFSEDNLTVVLEEGAYLDGKLEFNGCNHLRVCGAGVVANISYHLLKYRVLFDLLACTDVQIEDITLTDSEFWNLRVFGCENVAIDNVKIIGSYQNSDGIDVCGSRNVRVRHCFTRVWDDSLVVKGFDDRDKTSVHVVFEDSGTDMTKAFEKTGNCEHVSFSDCVLWNDFARPIEIGVSMRCESVSDILFDNIDIIHSPTGYPIMGAHHGDRAEVSNITFSDIRIEDCPGAQLFDFRITSSGWNTDTRKGFIHDLYFKNISLVGKPGIDFLPEMSRIEGYSEENNISNITFENIDLLGLHPKNIQEMNLVCNEYVKNIVVKTDTPNMKMVRSKIEIENPFMNQGAFYKGTVKTTFTNCSKERVQGHAWLHVSPKNTSTNTCEKFCYDLDGGESVGYLSEMTLLPGKSVLRVQSDEVNLISDWKLLEHPLILQKEPVVFEMVNYYGIRRNVILSADDQGITLESDIMLDGELILYTAAPVPAEAGEVLFTVEETDFAESMAVCMGRDGKQEMAPQLRCPAEIWYVFHNMPKVEKIHKLVLAGSKTARVTYKELGIEKDIFVMELLAQVPEMEPYRYPLTMFHSVTPEESCHMFAAVQAGTARIIHVN